MPENNDEIVNKKKQDNEKELEKQKKDKEIELQKKRDHFEREKEKEKEKTEPTSNPPNGNIYPPEPKQNPVKSKIKPLPLRGKRFFSKNGDWVITQAEIEKREGIIKVTNQETLDEFFSKYIDGKWHTRIQNHKKQILKVSSSNYEKLIKKVVEIFDGGGVVVENLYENNLVSVYTSISKSKSERVAGSLEHFKIPTVIKKVNGNFSVYVDSRHRLKAERYIEINYPRIKEVIRNVVRELHQEVSQTGAISGYSTPYAFVDRRNDRFKKKRKDFIDGTTKRLGFTRIQDLENPDPFYGDDVVFENLVYKRVYQKLFDGGPFIRENSGENWMLRSLPPKIKSISRIQKQHFYVLKHNVGISGFQSGKYFYTLARPDSYKKGYFPKTELVGEYIPSKNDLWAVNDDYGLTKTNYRNKKPVSGEKVLNVLNSPGNFAILVKSKQIESKTVNEGIPETIYKQIGHPAFFMMGAKNIIKGKDSKGREYLSWKIGRNAKGINYIKITYESGDTYHMEFGKIHGSKYNIKWKSEGLHFNDLRRIIKMKTGLALSI